LIVVWCAVLGMHVVEINKPYRLEKSSDYIHCY
jgi:hypothetical protein